ncbi:MAG TPA: alpha/beta hydrolase-fold protein [Thermoanaerobaculia bacterium]|nr:alpha/beta hydrolase-fold protein [Thermoanaerobaculia bacterium]
MRSELKLEQHSETREELDWRSAPNTRTGNFRLFSQLQSRFLPEKRDIIVYLPPGYEDNHDRRYPVLYMQDGQNLFDSVTAFGGQEWSLDETAERLILKNQIEPIIIVGINNTGIHRVDEYTPTRERRVKAGGKAKAYGELVVEDLKPFIDHQFRTLSDRDNTALGGSSLGGLVTMYLGIRYPEVFGKLAVISPAVWWDRKVIVKMVNKLRQKLNQRIWLDMGTAESRGGIKDARILREALVAKGWKLGDDLHYLEAKGADHSEWAWSQRVDPILRFLFPPKEAGAA